MVPFGFNFNLNNHRQVMGWRQKGSLVKLHVPFATGKLSSSSIATTLLPKSKGPVGMLMA
uniref:Uncharacterized protein n=1 Tax=Physcomitrium patens TaxID=3218 RepID=A0A2K1J7E9_PHYPA|nr:hypothetical protein PHYPA_020574 [Physcomitrium patens]